MESKSGGIGLLGVLFLIFLVLKLTGNIDWSWLYVTMPLWIWIPAIGLVFLTVFIFAGIGSLFRGRKRERPM